MTYISQNDTAANGVDLFSSIDRAFSTFAKRRDAWLKKRRIMNELYSLSDRELSELGICRSIIPQIARNTED